MAQTLTGQTELEVDVLERMLCLEGAAAYSPWEWLEQSYRDPRGFWRELRRWVERRHPLAVKSTPFERYDFYHDLILRHRENDAPALCWYGQHLEPRPLSYLELGVMASRRAAAWQRRGAKAGEVVGLLRPAGLELTVSLLAALKLGLVQCLALVPGVSRSGATISAGLFLGLDRELAARFGFLLAIPAVFASGLFSLPDAFHPSGEGMSASGPQLLVATVIAFVVGLAAVAWFLRFLVRHGMYWFVAYRVLLGTVVLILLGTGVVAAV